MGKHTPGPWRLLEVANGVNVEPDVAKVYIQSNRYDGSQSLTRLANARLIAAAPAMLEQLRSVLETIEESGEWWIDCPSRGGFDADAIREVIAEATQTAPDSAPAS